MIEISRRAEMTVFELAALVAIAVASLLLIVPNQMNWDVSWYVVISERVLDGGIYGVDFIEVNPPASLWLYLGPVAFARFIGASAEAVILVYTYLVVAFTSWLTWRLLRDDPASRVWLSGFIIVAVFSSAILPMRDFAQREHFAMMLLLPYAAMALVRIGGAQPGPAFVVAAALCGGVMASIKPLFVIVAIAPPLTAAAFMRNWRLIFAPEACGAGAVFLACVAAASWLHPEFLTQSLPLILSLYAPDAWPYPLWRLEILVCALCLSAATVWAAKHVILTGSKSAAASILFTACSLCFFAIYILQAKGFGYHAMPISAMLALALVSQLHKAHSLLMRSFLTMLAALVLTSWIPVVPRIDHAPLAAAIRSNGARAKVLMLGVFLPSAHPAVRMADAQWVSRVPGAWALESHRRLKATGADPQTQAERDAHAARARQILLEDLRDNRPDVLLIQRAPFNWGAELGKDPEFAHELLNYREHSTGYKAFDARVDVFVRSP
jgi:hypothetical protein